MAWMILVALSSVIVIMVLVGRARRWIPRFQVSRATLAQDGIDGPLRLVRFVARRVYPVRLVGIGGPAHRLDLALIDEQPDLDVCGVSARELAPLVDEEAYLVYHPVYIEVWLRTSLLSVRRAIALPRVELLRDHDFVMHDPDGIGVIDDRYRRSVGTIQISVTPRLHLYLEVLIKPAAPRLGPGSTDGRGFSGLRG